MSDPVTNAEVEDVLSSIRRLVSEDKRPLQAPQAAPQTDRLVLTPALRVQDTVPPSQDTEAPSAEGAETTETHSATADETLSAESIRKFITDDETVDVPVNPPVRAETDEIDDGDDEVVVPEDRSLVSDLADDYSSDPYHFDDDEDETGEGDGSLFTGVQTSIDPALTDGDTFAPEQGQLDTRDEDNDLATRMEQIIPKLKGPAEAESIATDDGGPTYGDDDPSEAKAAALSAKIAALETAIGNISDSWEPDDTDEESYQTTDLAAMEWEDDDVDEAPAARLHFAPFHTPAAQDVVDADEVEAVEDEDEAGVDEADADAFDPPVADARAVDAPLSDAFEAPEAADPDLPEPTGEPGERSRKPTAFDAAAALGAAPAFGGPEAEPSETDMAAPAPTDDTDAFDLEDGTHVIDEEMLRDMVSEIVRAELQGALGERITRNVRKLVRREIHRALTAQELE